MSDVQKTFEHVKAVVLKAHHGTTLAEKITFYDSWANNYDQDVAVLEYRAPSLAANSVHSHFRGDRGAAAVLDIACGTGLVARQMEKHGFRCFTGIDGSEGMLRLARDTGLYQDLKHAVLGENPLPVQWGTFDVVVITGALSVGQVPVGEIRDLCRAAKHGGYVCMTTRSNAENLDYKVALEREIKQMEAEGLWSCVEVTEVQDWERGVSEDEDSYITGCVFLCKKL